MEFLQNILLIDRKNQESLQGITLINFPRGIEEYDGMSVTSQTNFEQTFQFLGG